MRRLLVILGLALGFVSGPVAAQDARPIVVVIDSGVGLTPELRPHLVAEYDMAALPARPAFQPRYDHGTMVATILTRAARTDVGIVSMRIDDPAGCPPGASPPCQPSYEPVAAAIRKAIELRPDAINISLELQEHPAIVEAVREAAEAGITVVLAAGNHGAPAPANRTAAMAGFPRTVLVGALDSAGRAWAGSNRPEAGSADYDYVWRLGVDVPTAGRDGRLLLGTGTSFAAPLETARRVSALSPRRVQVAGFGGRTTLR